MGELGAEAVERTCNWTQGGWKGDRPAHIKFMTFPPSRREGQTRSAKPKQEKKMETGQCEKRLARRGRAAVRLPSPAGRGWHLNGLVFDWPTGLKHWRATPL